MFFYSKGGMKLKIEKMDALLKESLPPKRYEHSVNVMYEAVILAHYYDVDEKKIRIASLLHDCGREIPKHEAAAKAKELGLKVTAIEEAQPILLHAKLGKVIAEQKYQVDDEEILNAILLHTTGGKNMTTFDMVVFLADLIEPERKQKNVEKLRYLTKKNLELAMLEALKSNMDFLMQQGRYIHPDCLECWNYLLFKRDEGPDNGR